MKKYEMILNKINSHQSKIADLSDQLKEARQAQEIEEQEILEALIREGDFTFVKLDTGKMRRAVYFSQREDARPIRVHYKIKKD